MIVFVVGEVDGAAADLGDVSEDGLVNVMAVVAFAAEGGYERGGCS